jgi:transposase InsO family protein
MSTFFNEVCTVLGVKHVNTTAYHPQANGVAERFHRTMNQALGFYVNAAGNDWDTVLPFFLMSYRAAPSTVTGYSPYYLLHGREMVMPNSHNLRAKLSPEAERVDEAGRLRRLQSALRLANKKVQERITTAHARNKRYYDRTAERRELSEGDVVYLYDPAVKPRRCKKFVNFWRGPCRVVRRTNKPNYLIEDASGKESVVHINRLKIAKDPEVWDPKQTRPRPVRNTKKCVEKKAEEEPLALPSRPMFVPQSQGSNPRSPSRQAGNFRDAPDPDLAGEEIPTQNRVDRDYSPPDSPRSRFELRTTRAEPPVTRAMTRQQVREQ